MPIENDPRTVLTLDAGGTKLVFSAVRGGVEMVEPWSVPTAAGDLDACLAQIREGLREAHERTGRAAVAVSLAFPGPADYAAGIVGDLPNLPAFRGGVALGPMLEDAFGLPAFLRNDGDLFALGEAKAGLLPWVNERLAAAGNPKRYRNLVGVTLGTGFGGGIVHGGRLLAGDNGAAGEIALLRHKLEPGRCAEATVSGSGVRRVYAAAAGVPLDAAPEPREIAAIAGGGRPGDPSAAREAFRQLGEVAGDALAGAVSLFDGLAVIGGGLSAAAPLFFPALLAELRGSLVGADGRPQRRLRAAVFDLEDLAELTAFLAGAARPVPVPGSVRSVPYDAGKKLGVGLSRLGTSRAIAIGAWAVALEELDGAASHGGKKARPEAAASTAADVVEARPGTFLRGRP